MNITWLSWVASGLTLIGNVVLIKYKTWKTFVIFAVGNAMFVYYWIAKEEWATMILCSVFLAMNVWGIVSWRKSK
jgi:hypothetical protein